jgi:hypothetical protein
MYLPALGDAVQLGRQDSRERHDLRRNPWRANRDGHVVDISTRRPAVVSQGRPLTQEGLADAGAGAHDGFFVSGWQHVVANLGEVDGEAGLDRSLRQDEVIVLYAAELRDDMTLNGTLHTAMN